MEGWGFNIGAIIDLVISFMARAGGTTSILAGTVVVFFVASVLFHLGVVLFPEGATEHLVPYIAFTKEFAIRRVGNTIYLPCILVAAACTLIFIRAGNRSMEIKDWLTAAYISLLTFIVIPVINSVSATYNAIFAEVIAKTYGDLIHFYKSLSAGGAIATAGSMISLLYSNYHLPLLATVILLCAYILLAIDCIVIAISCFFMEISPFVSFFGWAYYSTTQDEQKKRSLTKMGHLFLLSGFFIIPLMAVLITFNTTAHAHGVAYGLAVLYQFRNNRLIGDLVEYAIPLMLPQTELGQELLRRITSRGDDALVLDANCSAESPPEGKSCADGTNKMTILFVAESLGILICLYLSWRIAAEVWKLLRG